MGGVVALLDKTPFLFGFETGSKCAITNGQVEILKLGKECSQGVPNFAFEFGGRIMH